MQYFSFVVVAWILGVGLYGIVTSRHLVHLIMCLIVVQSSTYVLLLGVGYVTGAVAPAWLAWPRCWRDQRLRDLDGARPGGHRRRARPDHPLARARPHLSAMTRLTSSGPLYSPSGISRSELSASSSA